MFSPLPLVGEGAEGGRGRDRAAGADAFLFFPLPSPLPLSHGKICEPSKLIGGRGVQKHEDSKAY